MFIGSKAYIAPSFIIKAADAPWEHQGVIELRRQVFCEEQKLFIDHDRDEIDKIAIPLAAISTSAGMQDQVVGTVRIHNQKDNIWWGSRLAVDQTHRRVGHLGAELIRLAVTTAHGMGCDHFYAHVQHQNENLFKRLHWEHLDELDIHGQKHILMEADLDYYPAFSSPYQGWQTMRKARL